MSAQISQTPELGPFVSVAHASGPGWERTWPRVSIDDTP